MSLIRPCSVCGKKEKGKDANVTTAWYDVEGTRHALRQYMCIGCFAQSIVPLEVSDEDSGMTCPLCHADSSDNLDPTYYTCFVPGTGRIDLELATDPACAAILRVRAEVGGQRLASFNDLGPGSRPKNELYSAWDELGLGRRVS